MSGFDRTSFRRTSVRGFSVVPMLTPFTRQGALDEAAAARLVEHIVSGGSQGVLVAGTTGEAVSMPLAMRVRLVQIAVTQARGRAVVYGGIGDNSLAHSIELSAAFLDAGAAAVVAHLPSYYPIDAAGMEAHLRTLADGVTGPLFLYNIPQTTRLSLPLDVIERLSHHPRIVGIKDSEPDGDRQEKLARRFADRADFAVFCGSVPFTSQAMQAGADGYVPSAGNFAPAAARALMDRCVANDVPGAAAAQQRVDAISAVYQKGRPVTQALCAMKAALEVMGLGERHMLPPLRACSDAEVAGIRAGLQTLGLLT